MSRIQLTDDRSGLDGFPEQFTPIGRDEFGDILARDEQGRVWSFAHGEGSWSEKLLAFASTADLLEYVSFQPQLVLPEEANLSQLRARKAELEAFIKGKRNAPYAREAVQATLEDLRERISDERWRTSKRGQSILVRQELGKRCDHALREAGAQGTWMVRPHVDLDQAMVVAGPLEAPWDEARVRELLLPLVGKFQLVFRKFG